MNINEKFQELGVVPVVVIEDVNDALPLAKALVEGGLPCAEVTFRTEAAAEAIRLMTEAYPEMLVGAGTVLTTAQVNEAVEAGAKFIVSPGFDPEIVDYCLAREIPVLPGCATFRSSTGSKTRNGSCEVLPGRTGRRTSDDQGNGCSVSSAQIHADRWNQSRELKRLSGI